MAKEVGPELIFIICPDIEPGLNTVLQSRSGGEEVSGVMRVEPSRRVEHIDIRGEILISKAREHLGQGMELGIAVPSVDEATLGRIEAQSGRVRLAVGRNDTFRAIEVGVAFAQLLGPPKAQVAGCDFNTNPIQDMGNA